MFIIAISYWNIYWRWYKKQIFIQKGLSQGIFTHEKTLNIILKQYFPLKYDNHILLENEAWSIKVKIEIYK